MTRRVFADEDHRRSVGKITTIPIIGSFYQFARVAFIIKVRADPETETIAPGMSEIIQITETGKSIV